MLQAAECLQKQSNKLTEGRRSVEGTAVMSHSSEEPSLPAPSHRETLPRVSFLFSLPAQYSAPNSPLHQRASPSPVERSSQGPQGLQDLTSLPPLHVVSLLPCALTSLACVSSNRLCAPYCASFNSRPVPHVSAEYPWVSAGHTETQQVVSQQLTITTPRQFLSHGLTPAPAVQVLGPCCILGGLQTQRTDSRSSESLFSAAHSLEGDRGK